MCSQNTCRGLSGELSNVFASDTPSIGLMAVPSNAVVQHELPVVKGQFVRIELPGENRTLSLAEVEVFEKGKNIAIGQTAKQINTRRGAGPERAVDGNCDGDYQKGSVTHTEQGIANPWWEVDLGRAVEIDKIVLSNRMSLSSRLDGFTLTVLDANRQTVFSKEGCAHAGQIIFSGADATPPRSMQWAGMKLVTISEFPDYIDASGGQFFGAFVVNLDADSPAAAAGFKNGDTIIRAGTEEVRTLEDLEHALKAQPVTVTCEIFRGYRNYEITIKR